jgi:5-methylcytosine-specific restriction endonuclease McrA
VPLEVHHVHPLAHGGPNTPANKVSLCSNAHSATHDLLDKMLKGRADWRVRLHYGWRIRRLAKRGYNAIKAAQT